MSTLDKVAAGIADPAKRKAFQALYTTGDLSAKVTANLNEVRAALTRFKQATAKPTLADQAAKVLAGLPTASTGTGGKRTIR